MILTDRERFCAMLSTGALHRGDVVVVLTGDGTARVATAFQLIRQGAAPRVLISGGFHHPPYSLNAGDLAAALYGMGLSPAMVETDEVPRNTREQAVHTVALAKDRGWRSLLLVASPEHQFRAFLSFVRALDEAGLRDTVRLVNVPASDLKWTATPAGRDESRLAMLAWEFARIADYHDKGHVASYADGIDYLTHWEAQ